MIYLTAITNNKLESRQKSSTNKSLEEPSSINIIVTNVTNKQLISQFSLYYTVGKHLNKGILRSYKKVRLEENNLKSRSSF